MPERDGDLAAMIARFRESVRDRIADNDEFHEDLDGANPMTFLGVTGTEYRIENHEALVWIDPEGYIAEQRAWQDARDGEEHRLTVEFLSDPDQRPVVRELALAIRRNRIAPFVGSGGSACLNFPTWRKALSDLVVRIATGADATIAAECKKAEDAIAAGDLIGAGSLLYAANKTVVDNFVSTTFAVPPDLVLDDVTGITRLLPEVTDGCLITTNFDRLIEMVFEESKKPIEGFMHGSQKLHKFAVNLAKGDRCIL